jgi:SOS-response transcriptional repressor LexA
MGDVGEQLIEDLMRLKPESLTANAWAVEAGVSRTIWADIRRHGNPSRRTLEKLLAAAHSNLAEFEALRIGPSPRSQHQTLKPHLADLGRAWGQAPLPPLPVVETKPAGEWGGAGTQLEVIRIASDKVVDLLIRPASLAVDVDAYAITIVGDSMWPRYRPGRRVAVSPAAPVSIGDDVLLLFHRDGQDDQEGLLKELVRRSATSFELRQFCPDKTFVVPADAIDAVHKVVGEVI